MNNITDNMFYRNKAFVLVIVLVCIISALLPNEIVFTPMTLCIAFFSGFASGMLDTVFTTKTTIKTLIKLNYMLWIGAILSLSISIVSYIFDGNKLITSILCVCILYFSTVLHKRS